MGKRLDFMTNWNGKLHCDCYTTFRRHREHYYVAGEQFEVWLDKKWHHNAEVLNVKTMTLKQACSSQLLTYLDTGYNTLQFEKLVRTIYKNKIKEHEWDTALFDLVLLRKLKTP